MLNSKVRMRHQTAFNTNDLKQPNWELPIEKKTCSKKKKTYWKKSKHLKYSQHDTILSASKGKI